MQVDPDNQARLSKNKLDIGGAAWSCPASKNGFTNTNWVGNIVMGIAEVKHRVSSQKQLLEIARVSNVKNQPGN